MNFNRDGTLLMSTMQQIDDGELDAALSSSNEEEGLSPESHEKSKSRTPSPDH